ncbi:hypothetical protein WN943_011544 [Citrus x changshan-huyou]
MEEEGGKVRALTDKATRNERWTHVFSRPLNRCSDSAGETGKRDEDERDFTKQVLNAEAESFFDKEEIKSTIDEIGERLDIICAKEEIMLLDPLDDEEFEEFRSSELRQVRLDSLKEGEKIHEDEHNKVVFDALRELYNF